MTNNALLTDNPFTPTPSDEAGELNALTRALQLAQGFTLLLVRCNQSGLHDRLIADLKSRLTDFRIQEIPIYAQIPHLLHVLRERLDHPPPDAVFVYGLEAWLSSTEEAETSPFIANLNAARNYFPQDVPCPLVLWLPEHLLTIIKRGAPDLPASTTWPYSTTFRATLRRLCLCLSERWRSEKKCWEKSIPTRYVVLESIIPYFARWGGTPKRKRYRRVPKRSAPHILLKFHRMTFNGSALFTTTFS